MQITFSEHVDVKFYWIKISITQKKKILKLCNQTLMAPGYQVPVPMLLPIMGGQEKERNNLEVFNLVDVDVLELFLHLLHAHLHGVHRALRILNSNTIIKIC